MKKLAPVLLAFCLYAADPWQSKPFADWSEKDVQKILNNSPWARAVNVSTGPPMGGDGGGFDANAGPGRVPGQNPSLNTGVALPSDAPVNTTGSSSRRVPRDDAGVDFRALPLTVRWESALPIKHARGLLKSGSPLNASPEAAKFLEDNSVYLITVSGLPPTFGMNGQNLNKPAILAQTSLSSKSKNLRPADVIIPPPGKFGETLFVFHKTTPFTAEDKDVEFSTKLGPLDIRTKFRLKDMLYNGNLEL